MGLKDRPALHGIEHGSGATIDRIVDTFIIARRPSVLAIADHVEVVLLVPIPSFKLLDGYFDA